eukprot:m.52235 g.52235  ORF g.52235 m.52235 type:complete len:687 (-) comp48425_c0_seq1:210-2270(-)
MEQPVAAAPTSASAVSLTVSSTPQETCDWLLGLGAPLDRYAGAFRTQMINGSTLITHCFAREGWPAVIPEFNDLVKLRKALGEALRLLNKKPEATTRHQASAAPLIIADQATILERLAQLHEHEPVALAHLKECHSGSIVLIRGKVTATSIVGYGFHFDVSSEGHTIKCFTSKKNKRVSHSEVSKHVSPYKDTGLDAFVIGTYQAANGDMSAQVSTHDSCGYILLESLPTPVEPPTAMTNPSTDEDPPAGWPALLSCQNHPLEFPLILDDAGRRAIADFSGNAYFFGPGDKEEKLHQHLVAYRQGGGVVYLGLQLSQEKKLLPDERRAKWKKLLTSPIQPTPSNLEHYQGVFQDWISKQVPHCNIVLAPQHLPRSEADRDRVYVTFASVLSASRKYFGVIRLVVCPSEYPVHFAFPSDVNIHERQLEATPPIPWEHFRKVLQRSREAFSRYDKEASAPLLSDLNATIQPDPIKFLSPGSRETSNSENKAILGKNFLQTVLEHAETYVPAFANVDGGILCLGFRNERPHHAVGLFVSDSTWEELRWKLAHRFSLHFFSTNGDASDVCFPEATQLLRLSATKLQVTAVQLLQNEKGEVLGVRCSPAKAELERARIALEMEKLSKETVIIPAPLSHPDYPDQVLLGFFARLGRVDEGCERCFERRHGNLGGVRVPRRKYCAWQLLHFEA